MDWIAGWNKRIKLTISGSCIEGDLSDFPIMIHLDSTCSGVFNEVGSNSKRMSVVAPDQSQCYVEIERWDESTKNAWLWVKVPTLSSGVSSELYLYYDNLQPDNSSYVGTVGETSAQNVWDSNFVGIWHMNQDPTGAGACIKDSTSNTNDGTPMGSMTSGDLVDGKIGKALNFDCNDEYISLSQVFQSPTELTWELCAKSKVSNTTEQRLFTYNNDGIFVITSINGASTSDCIRTYAGGQWSSSTVAYSVLSYHHIVGTAKNNDYLYLFVDGEKIGSGVSLGIMGDLGSQLARNIGASRSVTQLANGILDEVRTSKIVRSAFWIKATYYSNWNQLLSYGTEETVSLGILPGWGNRLKLTIQNDYVDNTLTNFPVMIKISEDSGYNSFDNRSIFYELETNINRKKIAITDSTGVAQCFVEIERFSCAETEAVLWTKLPVIYAGVGTHFYLYYDKNQADNVEFVGDVNSIVAQNVWDDSFKLVHHFAQDPSGGPGCIKDSTSNIIHGTPQGSMISDDLVDGKIGKALVFDGIDDYIKTPYNAILDLDQYVSITMEAVVNVTIGNYYYFWTIQYDLSAFVFFYIDNAGKVTLRLYQYTAPSDNYRWSTDASVGAGWHTVAATHTNNVDPVFCVDGVSVAYSLDSSGGSNIKHTTDGKDSLIGSNYTEGDFTTGIQEEIRILNIARSIPWIKATYHSNWDDLIIFEKEDITASWLSDWSKRIKLTIDHTKVDSSLINFPVLVTLTSGVQSDLFNEMSYSDRKKIALTKDDGVTQCFVEIEQFDTTVSGKVNLWTKVPTIVFDSDTDFYLYYDSSKDDNTVYVGDIGSASAQSVWDDGFKMVHHLQDVTTSTVKDSTSNTKDGTKKAVNEPTEVIGKIGNGQHFDGLNDYISLPQVVSSPTEITWELINKSDVSDTNEQRVLVYNDDGMFISVSLNAGTANLIRVSCYTTAGNWSSTTSSYSVTDWHYITGRAKANDYLDIFVDGVKIGASVVTGSIQDFGSQFSRKIGISRSLTVPADGIIDEVRISNIARSTPWIKATYYSSWNTLLTYGSVQNYTPPPDYYYHGYVKEKGGYVSRKLYLYRRDTGLLIDSCMSNAGTGYYLLETSVSGEHFILALDDDAGDSYNALVQDRLYPNGI